jgi:hypothetical protein
LYLDEKIQHGGAMAAQIFYTFLINGSQYILIGMSGGDLASPEQFGMQMPDLHDGCNQVFYHAMYEFTWDTLYLKELTFREKNENYISSGGTGQTKYFHQAANCTPNASISFTGKIRLAKEFIKEPYINMGYQKAMAFKTVLDITLKDGQVIKVKNRSLEMEQKRGALKQCYKPLNRQEYSKSLNKLEKILYTFSLDMDLE